MKLLCELNDQILLGTPGLSSAPPRHAARAIACRADGMFAMMYAKRFDLYSLPGGGIETGEDVLCALRRELLEETGCPCMAVEELGLVYENRACQNFTQYSYYYAVTVPDMPASAHLTEKERAVGTIVLWVGFKELCQRICTQSPATIQQKYIQARDMAAIAAYGALHP